MNPKLYELMQEAGYAAPNLAPRANKLAELLLLHLLSYAKADSVIEEEIRELMDNKEATSN